jgi:hypothetical protein
VEGDSTGVATGGTVLGSTEDVGMGVVVGEGAGDDTASFATSFATSFASLISFTGACGSGLAGDEVDLGDSMVAWAVAAATLGEEMFWTRGDSAGRLAAAAAAY